LCVNLLANIQPNMKKTLLILGAFAGITMLSLFNLSSVHSNPGGAPGGASGAPADNNNTCARSGCHSGSATDQDGILSSNVPSTGYVPGETYTISVLIVQQGISRFGFQVSPQAANGAVQGTITITDAARTQLISGKYVTHRQASINSLNSNSWEFNWTAPAAGTGTVNFYGAAMASNANGNTSGDQVFRDVLSLNEDASVGINSASASTNFMVFPNPAEGNALNIASPRATTIEIYSLSGQRMHSFEATAGHNTINIEQLPAGMYYLIAPESGVAQRFVRR
jgi:hypothetical protein